MKHKGLEHKFDLTHRQCPIALTLYAYVLSAIRPRNVVRAICTA